MEKSSFSRSFSLTFSLIFTDFSLALLHTQFLKAEVFLEFSSLLSTAISRLSFVGIFMKSALLCAFVSCWIFYMFLILMWISPSYELEFNAKTAFPCMLSVSMACCSWRFYRKVNESSESDRKRAEKEKKSGSNSKFNFHWEEKIHFFPFSNERIERRQSRWRVWNLCAFSAFPEQTRMLFSV